MKQFKELDEMVLKINEIEKKIGKWNFNNKKYTIAANLDNIKSNMIILDKMAKTEMQKKFNLVKDKIKDIKDNYKEAYDEMDTQKLKDLSSDELMEKMQKKLFVM